jgi:hypothetical protein
VGLRPSFTLFATARAAFAGAGADEIALELGNAAQPSANSDFQRRFSLALPLHLFYP